MPIPIACPSCQTRHKAPDSLAGRACRCKCGKAPQRTSGAGFAKFISAILLVVAVVTGCDTTPPAANQPKSPTSFIPPTPPPPPPPPPGSSASRRSGGGLPPPPGGEPNADAVGVQVIATLPDRDAKIFFAPFPRPFAALGTGVTDLTTGNAIGRIPAINKIAQPKVALSPNGKYFARVLTKDQQVSIEVTNVSGGAMKHTLSFVTKDKSQKLSDLEFNQSNELMAAVRNAYDQDKVLTWSMDDGQQIHEFLVPQNGDKYAFHPDGSRLARKTSQSLAVFSQPEGRLLATMVAPPKDTGILSFIFLDAMAFSPDGSELAAIMTGKSASKHVIVWDKDGRLVEQHNLGSTISAGYYLDGPLQWAPDGQGWLLHGNWYFDRKLGAIAWYMETPSQHNYPHRFLDNDHILATRGNFQIRELVSVEIPRQKIAAAAQSLKSGTPALLKPGDTVSIQVNVGECRFTDKEAVKNEILQAIEQRLSAGGLVKQDNGKITVTVNYSEAAGGQLRVVDGPFARGKDTGQRVQETISKLQVKMTSAAGSRAIWEKSVERGNPHMVHSATVDDASVREATFSSIKYLLKTAQIPYFVAADPAVPGLPLSVNLVD
jgi:hypothetical protein